MQEIHETSPREWGNGGYETKPRGSWEKEWLVLHLLDGQRPRACGKVQSGPDSCLEIPQLGSDFYPILLSLQTSEDDEASWRDPKGDMTPASTLPMSGDEPGFSKFSSV